MALFVEERRRIILDQLHQFGRVSVAELSASMHVSAVTIRQDLRALEDEGLLERTYGGAVNRTSPALPELSFHIRMGKRQREKAAIARAAAALVTDGDAIALDCSTTAYAMADLLKRYKKLTVVTNSLVIAQSFLDSPHIQVLLPGGRLRRDSVSLVGDPNSLPAINLNSGFMGARGVSLIGGISDVDADEVQIKSAIIARCISTVILVDGSKWGQVAAYTFMKPHLVTRIITSDDAPGDQVEQFRGQGINVDVVAVD
jgi:DeoR/GlpR family transcriptional regulator of sugar metabolism